MTHSGYLEIVYGPMYAGKSKWIDSSLNDYVNMGFSVAKIVHPDDSSRSGVKFSGESGSNHHCEHKILSDEVTIIGTDDLNNIDLNKFNVIGIDEAQFFKNVYNVVKDLVDIKNKRVLVACLDGDYNRDPWYNCNLLQLIILSNKSKKMSGKCQYCLEKLKSINFENDIVGIEAPFTKRLISSPEQKLIGGKEMYAPVCRYHYLNDTI